MAAEVEYNYQTPEKESSKKKKKRKDKIKIEEVEEDITVEVTHHSEEETQKKKKKRRKDKIEIEVDIPMESTIPEEEGTKKKKKKKKRKQEEEETIPEQPPIDMKIEIVNAHPQKIPPFIGYFPSGFNPQKNGGVEVNAFNKRPNRYQLAVTPKGSNVHFVGGSHSGEAEAAQVCTYALCVVDKLAQTIQIVPITANKIMRLDPIIGDLDSVYKEQVKEEEDAPVNKYEQVIHLTEKYGTKKARVKVKKDANLNRKADAETQKDLEDKVEAVQINEEGLGTSIVTPARNIPPHDLNADTPERAYPLDQIILQGEWDYLLDILLLVQSGAEMTPNSYPSFVSNRIQKLREIQDEEEMEKLACIFSYITYLIKFKEHFSERHASTPARIPQALYMKFSALFGGSGGHSGRPDERTDLIISYVLVLTLIADGYLTDPSDIAVDMKTTKLSLRKHYEALGCKTKVVNKATCFTLPVPLNFPKLSTRGRRRK